MGLLAMKRASAGALLVLLVIAMLLGLTSGCIVLAFLLLSGAGMAS